MKNVVLATGNVGKVKELSALLNEHGVKVLPQSDLNVGDVAETGTTFVENAIIKARHAAKITGLPAIADDFGLEVDALHGQPGIYSNRYGGEGATDQDNIEKLLSNLDQETHRSARFRCVIVYMQHQHDPSPLIFNGSWEGDIAWIPQGENGFGYDPIFLVPGLHKTAAQLSPEEKNKLSHRGNRFLHFQEQLLRHRPSIRGPLSSGEARVAVLEEGDRRRVLSQRPQGVGRGVMSRDDAVRSAPHPLPRHASPGVR